jgi:hypothetical protein
MRSGLVAASLVLAAVFTLLIGAFPTSWIDMAQAATLVAP